MSRAWRGAMPVALTLPPNFERRPRARRRRRRLAFGALLALGLALAALGFWAPARGSTAPDASAASAAPPNAWLHSLTFGDEFTVERAYGALDIYQVAALDVVDAERAQLGADADTLVLVTSWPFDSASVAGNWRYVVTARRVLRSEPAAAISRTAF